MRASSRELLQNVVEPPLREALLAFVDDLPDREKLLRRGRPSTRRSPSTTKPSWGGSSISRASRCAASRPITWASWASRALRPRLLALQSPGAAGFFLSRIVERASSLLPPPAGERVAHA